MIDNPETETGSEESEISNENGESEVVSTEVSASAEETSEEEEAQSEDDSGTSEEKWLVPGRFRTAEDLARSYQNLEAEFGRRNNELHRLKQERANPQVDPELEKLQFAEAVKRNPKRAIEDIARQEVAAVKQEARQVRFESEYARLLQNKEFQELEPVMTQIATQYGDLITDDVRSDPKLLHILFYAARGVKADERAAKAASQGKAKGERSAMKKTKVQVEGASGTKGHVKRNFEELSLEEMRKQLQKGDI